MTTVGEYSPAMVQTSELFQSDIHSTGKQGEIKHA